MAYTAPTITETGLSIPIYSDILNDLIEKIKIIYGQDIYLENDSQDYQMLSIFASKANDIMQLLQMVYNNRSPVGAIGAGLDSVVKINGITRKTKSYSTCPVVITGTAYTQINNGVVQDITGYKWSLPSSVIIGYSGSVTVTAICQTPGPIIANVGDINIIVTALYGWTSVNNAVAATPGTNNETDAVLRSRQASSVSMTSLTVLDCIRSAIAAISNVTRNEVYENDTNATNSDGIEAHSIAAVVEGGSDSDVASTIFNKKAPGTHTQGTTSVIVTDTYGQSNTIRFYRPTVVYADIVVNVKALTGYTDQTTADIKTKLAGYLNSLAIGTSITVSSLWGAALLAMASLSNPVFSITSLTVAKHGGTQGTADIAIAFNEVVSGNVNYITVNVA